ncbi:hypothetical protein ACS0TY_035951 [Phlomoides rotata]
MLSPFRFCPSIAASSHPCSERKRGDDIVRKTSTCSTYQVLNLNTRSAPGSGHSSPVLSPQRCRTMDLSLSDQSHQMPNVHPLPHPPGHHLKPNGREDELLDAVHMASETGATCAVKEVEMIPDDPKSAECIKQLEREIKFLKDLKHPNIVQYYGCEIYVHPGSVNKYIHEHCGAMTESIIRNFTRHILSGLAYLHNTKTIHRDIKGANLLVNASGVVKLADFGLAKLVFNFADKYKGSYSDSLGSVVCQFYCSYSGYHDELLWGASWLHKASQNHS